MKRCLIAAVAAFAGLASAQGRDAHLASGISTEAWYAVPDARGVQLVHVECGADYLDPREIVVEPGKPVELSVRSSVAGEEFVTGTGLVVAVGKQPRKVQFTPGLRGKNAIACRKAGTPDKDVHPRKKGVLHVGHPFGKGP